MLPVSRVEKSIVLPEATCSLNWLFMRLVNETRAGKLIAPPSPGND